MIDDTPAARLARIAALAERTWEDWSLACEFLSSRQPQLGGRTPLELMASAEGADQVERLLLGLEYSLPV